MKNPFTPIYEFNEFVCESRPRTYCYVDDFVEDTYFRWFLTPRGWERGIYHFRDIEEARETFERLDAGNLSIPPEPLPVEYVEELSRWRRIKAWKESKK